MPQNIGKQPSPEQPTKTDPSGQKTASEAERQEKEKIKNTLHDAMGRLVEDFSAMGHMPWKLADDLGVILDRVGLFDAATEAVLRAAIDLHAPGEDHANVIQRRMPQWFARIEANELARAVKQEQNGEVPPKKNEKTTRDASRL